MVERDCMVDGVGPFVDLIDIGGGEHVLLEEPVVRVASRMRGPAQAVYNHRVESLLIGISAKERNGGKARRGGGGFGYQVT